MDKDKIIATLIWGFWAQKKIDEHTSFELWGIQSGPGKGPCQCCMQYAAKILAGYKHKEVEHLLCQNFRTWIQQVADAEKAIKTWGEGFNL